MSREEHAVHAPVQFVLGSHLLSYIQFMIKQEYVQFGLPLEPVNQAILKSLYNCWEQQFDFERPTGYRNNRKAAIKNPLYIIKAWICSLRVLWPHITHLIP